MWPCGELCGVFSYPLLSISSLVGKSVFNTPFPLHYFLKLSSHFRLTIIKSKSLAFSLHPPASVSGFFLTVALSTDEKPLVSHLPSAQNGREPSCLASSWRSLFYKLSFLATAQTSRIQQWCDSRGRGNILEEKLLDLIQEAEFGWLPLGAGEQWDLLKSLKISQKHTFIKSYSSGSKGPRTI